MIQNVGQAKLKMRFRIWIYILWSSTHLPLNKLAAISQTIFPDHEFFVNEKLCILIKISPKFVPEGPIDNNPALI